MQCCSSKWCVFFSLVALLSSRIQAEERPANVGGFVTELMQMQASKEGMQLALWLPPEFFTESVFAQGNMTRMQAAEQVEYLKPYLVVGVSAGTLDAGGRMSFATESSLRERVRILTPRGQEFPPLTDVPPRVSAALAAFKVAFAANGGAQNENTFFLVFSAEDGEGSPVVQTEKKDKLSIILKKDRKFAEVKFSWYTPFDAITPATPCSKCAEKVSGKWNYCPFCGTKSE